MPAQAQPHGLPRSSRSLDGTRLAHPHRDEVEQSVGQALPHLGIYIRLVQVGAQHAHATCLQNGRGMRSVNPWQTDSCRLVRSTRTPPACVPVGRGMRRLHG